MKKSVLGIVICTSAGKIIKSTYGSGAEEAKNISDVVSQLTVKAKTIIRDLDPSVSRETWEVNVDSIIREDRIVSGIA